MPSSMKRHDRADGGTIELSAAVDQLDKLADQGRPLDLGESLTLDWAWPARHRPGRRVAR